MDSIAKKEEMFEQRVKWFRDAGLGMFIHWGLYSELGHGEWAQSRENIHPWDYAKLKDRFTAKRFDAAQWARLAKEGGAKYVVFTTRHHDGFSLWDTHVSDFNSMNCPAARDFVREYVEAVRQEGLKVGLYYSPMDWSWAAFNLDLPADEPQAWMNFVKSGQDTHPDGWKRFVHYVHSQLKELMTNYGKIDLLWYDGVWHQRPDQWGLAEINSAIRKLQPHIVMNNRAAGLNNKYPEYQEDYDTPENEIPLNIEPQQRPWEACLCMNDTWGYIPGDKNIKSVRQCLYMLLRVRSAGGNLLLNTSPKGDGAMPADNVRVMRELGRWLSENGESVYGTELAQMCPHGTGFFAQPGICTARLDKHTVYYHILRYLGKDEHCAKVDAQVTSATLLATGAKVKYKQRGQMVYFQGLPARAPDALDTVIKLKYKPGTAKSAWTQTYV